MNAAACCWVLQISGASSACSRTSQHLQSTPICLDCLDVRCCECQVSWPHIRLLLLLLLAERLVHACSHKMPMAWRSLPQRSSAYIMTRTLALSVVLPASTTSTDPTAPGKEAVRRLLLLSAERRSQAQRTSRCGEMASRWVPWRVALRSSHECEWWNSTCYRAQAACLHRSAPCHSSGHMTKHVNWQPWPGCKAFPPCNNMLWEHHS